MSTAVQVQFARYIKAFQVQIFSSIEFLLWDAVSTAGQVQFAISIEAPLRMG